MSVLLGGIEAGGTKTICALARAGGEIVAETRLATTTPAATLGAAEAFFTDAAARLGPLAALGIATFGPVDLHPASPTFGRLLATPKPGWAGIDWIAPFAARFGCPVGIDTDVNAAALAEALEGAGRGASTVVYVTVGTGIGGGVAIDGATLKGALHPEMGHVRVARHARDTEFRGVCPFHGDCVEGLASGSAIVARFGAPLAALPAGHEAPRLVGYYLGQLAASILLMLSPERLIFGGGVMQHEPLLHELRAAAAAGLNGYAGLGPDAAALANTIVAPGLGTRSGIRGALALARAAHAARVLRDGATGASAAAAPPPRDGR